MLSEFVASYLYGMLVLLWFGILPVMFAGMIFRAATFGDWETALYLLALISAIMAIFGLAHCILDKLDQRYSMDCIRHRNRQLASSCSQNLLHHVAFLLACELIASIVCFVSSWRTGLGFLCTIVLAMLILKPTHRHCVERSRRLESEDTERGQEHDTQEQEQQIRVISSRPDTTFYGISVENELRIQDEAFCIPGVLSGLMETIEMTRTPTSRIKSVQDFVRVHSEMAREMAVIDGEISPKMRSRHVFVRGRGRAFVCVCARLLDFDCCR